MDSPPPSTTPSAAPAPTTSPTPTTAPITTTITAPPRTPRKPRPNYTLIHRHPLPLLTHPLPPIQPTNPLSLLHLAWALLSHYLLLNPPSSHPTHFHGYFDPTTNSVHVTDPGSVRGLWEMGFFGKGSLSRSEPEWVRLREERMRQREVDRVEKERRVVEGEGDKEGKGKGGKGGQMTAAEVTRKRREERRREKLERARVQAETLDAQLRAEGKLEPIEVENDKEKEREKVRIREELKAEEEGSAKEPSTLQDGYTDPPSSTKPTADKYEQQAQEDALLFESIQTANDTTSLPQQPTHYSTTSTTGADTVIPSTTPLPSDQDRNQEHLQLTPSEAFFLSYGLGVLSVHPSPSSTSLSTSSKPYTSPTLLRLFSSHTSFPPSPLTPTSPPKPTYLETTRFLTQYTAYHHYRSLGWVVRSGIKFGVDLLLYYRGPAFSHAEFGVLVVPSYDLWSDEELGRADGGAGPGGKGGALGGNGGIGLKRKDWAWLHAANRVQSQVRKTLVVCYVEVPPPSSSVESLMGGWEPEGVSGKEERDEDMDMDIGKILEGYKVREFVIKRWSPNRDRG